MTEKETTDDTIYSCPLEAGALPNLERYPRAGRLVRPIQQVSDMNNMRFTGGQLDGIRYVMVNDVWVYAGGPGMNYVIVDDKQCHLVPKGATEWAIFIPTVMGIMKVELSYNLQTEMFTATTSSGKEGKGHEPQQAVDAVLAPITAEEAGHD